MKPSALEREFETRRLQLIPHLPAPEREYKFRPGRRWAFDFCWPDLKTALEIEGGHWNQGRHNRARGYHADCTKYNAAVEAGWHVLRYTSDHLRDDPVAMFEQIERVLRMAMGEDMFYTDGGISYRPYDERE